MWIAVLRRQEGVVPSSGTRKCHQIAAKLDGVSRRQEEDHTRHSLTGRCPSAVAVWAKA